MEFLENYHKSLTIPVPIDLIAERDLRLSIIPGHELQKVFGIEGFLSKDCSSITIDRSVMENRYYRYRFTIAHEIGHLVLHRSLYENAEFETIEEWIAFTNQIGAEEYRWAEWQAYRFAGLVLVPVETLHNRFSDAIRKARNAGFRVEDHFEEFVEFISRPLSREFDVSTEVIEKQIKLEKLKP